MKKHLKENLLSSIKNIVFDMGNVIIDIDLSKTTQALANISGRSFDRVQHYITSENLFYRYEIGELSDSDLRNSLREGLVFESSDTAIDIAWQALLLEMPRERLELIQELGTRYQVFLLSNTSPIHFHEIERRAVELLPAIGSYSALFDRVFLSYQMQKMKPDDAIFLEMIEAANMLPQETLFIDDNYHNTQAAIALGIQTVHLEVPRYTILDYLA